MKLVKKTYKARDGTTKKCRIWTARWWFARKMRIDRRVAEDEIVRVTLCDKDGTVLFKGEVR